jgi:hypothetical protein
MNIDISNAHCGFRTLSVTHAWPRVARHSNPPARRSQERRAGARGRAQPAVGRPLLAEGSPGRPTAASQVASLNVTLADRAGGAALAASPTRPAGFSSPSARTVVSSCAREGARRWRPGAGGSEPGGPSNDVGVVPARGGARVGVVLLACPRPASPSTGGAAAPRANRLRDLGSGETTRRI